MIRQAVPPLKNQQNPNYGIDDFKAVYPHFFTVSTTKTVTEEDGTTTEVITPSEPLTPVEVIEMYIEFAHSCVKKWRYHKGWKLCMSLFIAHFITLYMISMTEPGSSAAKVINAGMAKGVAASKSVDGVSVSYDFSLASSGLEDWATWNLTVYGQQFATLAKMYAPRSIYIP